MTILPMKSFPLLVEEPTLDFVVIAKFTFLVLKKAFKIGKGEIVKTDI